MTHSTEHSSKYCPILAYVRHPQVPDYLRLGWMVVGELGETHGEWSCLMGWACGCEMRLPKKEAAFL